MMKRLSYLLVLAGMMASCSCPFSSDKVVYLQDYLDEAARIGIQDAGYAIHQALEDCAETGAARLVLPGDTLRISPEYAYERYEYISNNNPSMKKIAFLMEDMEDFSIIGNGTHLLFSGYVSAFSLENCRNISISDLSIDYERPFVSEGTITAVGPGWYELEFPEDYLVDVQGTRLRFRDRQGRTYPFSNLLEFDRDKKEVAYHVHDYWIWGDDVQASAVGNGRFRISRKDFGQGTVGNTMVFGASGRYHPAFTLLGCSGFTLKDTGIYHCCGMGVIAQSSQDIELNRVQVVPAPGSGRTISISADATHFVNCKGYIRLLDCVFKNQKDDATNIHGWYMAVDRVTGEDRLLLKWKNSGQYGVRFIQPGRMLELVDNRTMTSYAHMEVEKVRYLNSHYAEVTFVEPLPEEVEPAHVVAEDEAYPEVLISGCYFGNNRARGLLLGSRAKTVVEHCTFHTPGAAILFEGDGNYWYEQSGVREVVIRNNVFEDCLYGSASWGDACIAVGSGIPERSQSIYHRNILVEDNVFKYFDTRLVSLYCVDGFTFRNNELVQTRTYPASGSESDRFVAEHCENVRFD